MNVLLVLLPLLALSPSSSLAVAPAVVDFDVLMPNVTTDGPETYLCTSVQVPEELDGSYVIGFQWGDCGFVLCNFTVCTVRVEWTPTLLVVKRSPLYTCSVSICAACSGTRGGTFLFLQTTGNHGDRSPHLDASVLSARYLTTNV